MIFHVKLLFVSVLGGGTKTLCESMCFGYAVFIKLRQGDFGNLREHPTIANSRKNLSMKVFGVSDLFSKRSDEKNPPPPSLNIEKSKEQTRCRYSRTNFF